jgi:hypothetical protein
VLNDQLIYSSAFELSLVLELSINACIELIIFTARVASFASPCFCAKASRASLFASAHAVISSFSII